jgi:heme exporter protein C
MALRASLPNLAQADKLSAILILIGAINIPIIHFSVEWWTSLHQGPTLLKAGGPAIDSLMLYPLLAMIIGTTLYFGSLLLVRTKAEVLNREKNSRWAKKMLLGDQL